MTNSISRQVDEFSVGFTGQIGDELASVFAEEQAALNASGVPKHAVAVGDTIRDASLLDHTGAPVTLFDSLGAGSAVLVFYRGAWCPFCNIALKTYQAELLPALRSRGVELVAISPQTPEGTDAAIANGSLEFTVLSDAGNQLVRSLGILTEPSAAARAAHTTLGFDVADSNFDATGDIPFPTVLVIDADRVVRFADVHVDYTTRTEVPEILAAVDALG